MFKQKKTSILPGKDITLTYSLIYLSLLLIFPLFFLFYSLKFIPWDEATKILSSTRVVDAFIVSFGLSFISAILSLIIGTIVAWVLIKYEFKFRKFFDSIVDLPFAMPTAVSGIALATLYSKEGYLGNLLYKLGITVSYTPLGIIVALIFVGLPFVIRAIQPAIQILDVEMEEAAVTLGATRFYILKSIVFPQLLPSMITGFTMSFARGLGEYGSVIFIAGNIPYFTEIVPFLIVTELEQFNYNAATILAVAMLITSFFLLVLLGIIGEQVRKKYG